MTRTEMDKMRSGARIRPADPAIQPGLPPPPPWPPPYNPPLDRPPPERRPLLAERLGRIGDGAEIRPPFHCDYGFNIRLGSGVFLNFNCVILDVVEVTIGDGTQIGPAVQIYAADHPRDPSQRRAGLELGKPVRI